MLTYVLQDTYGQIETTHSISAGLDYPGVVPEHSYLKAVGRVKYVTATDREAVQAFLDLSRNEGILPALESCHALAYCKRVGSELGRNSITVVTLSGRGDKDVEVVANNLGETI
jgi:tryptophan synthase beta chain